MKIYNEGDGIVVVGGGGVNNCLSKFRKNVSLHFIMET